ncbi:NADPH-dependent F420 reductase [Burkholderia pyrrocinia]|uniref:NADPH-dependent F420 reductase n=1 Tax=Burkholderia pyrrocinia TaxID=60550 RepID=UPI001046E011|nr:NAD(P)-binding domain-containing protein [Burkholderia pyrrocinia]TDA43236.1 NADP oxidoreductase [Burkholderia pyrrocinia]
MNKIGIIGAGAIGSAIAEALSRKGIHAVVANSRGPASLQKLVDRFGPTIQAGTREEAAAQEIVFVAVNWSKLSTALAGLPSFAGRTVIDTNNPLEGMPLNVADLGGRTSSEVFREWVPGAKVVKAFNHLKPILLSSDPRAEGGQRVLFYAGDDVAAKATVAQLIERLDFFGIDLGTLVTGGRLFQFPGGPLPSRNLVRYP